MQLEKQSQNALEQGTEFQISPGVLNRCQPAPCEEVPMCICKSGWMSNEVWSITERNPDVVKNSRLESKFVKEKLISDQAKSGVR